MVYECMYMHAYKHERTSVEYLYAPVCCDASAQLLIRVFVFVTALCAHRYTVIQFTLFKQRKRNTLLYTQTYKKKKRKP